MRWEALVGLRYLAATRNEAAPSIITVISVLAVAIGVTALIVVLSVMGGFEGDLRTKILGAHAHVLVSGDDLEPLSGLDALLPALDAIDGVEAVSPFVESELMISSSSQYSALVLRGIDLERVVQATDLDVQMREGRLEWLREPDEARSWGLLEHAGGDQAELEALREQTRALSAQLEAARQARAAEASGATGTSPAEAPAREGSAALRSPSMPPLPRSTVMPPLPSPAGQGDGSGSGPVAPRALPGVILGSELQESLNVVVGETVDIIDPDGPIGPTGPTPLVRRFRVVGVFHSGLYEYDNRYAFLLLDEARTFLGLPGGEVTGVELRVADPDGAGSVAAAVRSTLAARGRPELQVRDWMELNSTLFAALLLEKFVMGGIMMVIVMVASFAIVCVLIMVVIQRGAEIAILRTMGASQRSIMKVFVVQGGAIGMVGTVVGGAVGLAIALALLYIGFPLDPEVYYIDRLPVEVDPKEVIAIVVGAQVISLLATLYPSVQAARLDPAGGLRYE